MGLLFRPRLSASSPTDFKSKTTRESATPTPQLRSAPRRGADPTPALRCGRRLVARTRAEHENWSKQLVQAERAPPFDRRAIAVRQSGEARLVAPENMSGNGHRCLRIGCRSAGLFWSARRGASCLATSPHRRRPHPAQMKAASPQAGTRRRPRHKAWPQRSPAVERAAAARHSPDRMGLASEPPFMGSQRCHSAGGSGDLVRWVTSL